MTTSTAAGALGGGDVDVVIAGLAAAPPQTGAEALPIELSDPYFVTGERILVKSSNDEIKELPDLDSRTVCYQRGTVVGDDVQTANAFAKVLPLTHALAVMRYGLGVDPSGTGLHQIWGISDPAAMAALSLAVVAAFAAVMTAVALRVFSRSAVS